MEINALRVHVLQSYSVYEIIYDTDNYLLHVLT